MTLPNPTSNRPDGGGDERGDPVQPTETGARDAWSIHIATVSGIPIRLHFTFVLLLTWVAVFLRGGLSTALFLIGVFFCVVLHELGHSLVAQRYGYKVRDIVLYPIGGVASIEGTPRARHELWIALAGPAVNVVIALLLWAYLAATGGLPSLPPRASAEEAVTEAVRVSPLLPLLSANVALVLFNLIPAFPMDGGRVLRAVLALRVGRLRATRIAAAVGQMVAVAGGAYGLGLFGNRPSFSLVLIALFVFFGAGQETQAEQSREAVEGAPVGAAMVREFHTLTNGDSLRHAAEMLLATHQQDFPVVNGDEVLGVLSRGQLLRGLAQQGESAYVSEVMSRDVVFARPTDPLEDFLMRADGVQRAPVLVLEDERLVGMLTVENLMEFLTLRQIARARSERV